jgi:hypothetical protein
VNHKPGGGNVKIVNRKIDYSSVKPKINVNRKAANTIWR